MNKIKEFLTFIGQLIIALGGASAFVFILAVIAKVLYRLFIIGWNLW